MVEKKEAKIEIKTINLGKFIGGKKKDKEEIAKELFEQCKYIGFVRIANHGMKQELIDSMFEKSQAFFDLPLKTKMLSKWESPKSNRGYLSMGQELLDDKTGNAPRDIKETMEIGNEEEKDWANQWPKEEDAPKFKETSLEFFKQADKVHLDVLRCLAFGLGLDEEYFTKKCDGNHQNLRLLHYPQFEYDPEKGNYLRAGEHSDYGSVTLLFNQKGESNDAGLQVQKRGSTKWHFVTPVYGTILINIADLMQRWSNDVLVSTRHRVVVAEDETKKQIIKTRKTIAFFCNPNKETVCKCIETCCDDKENPAKYKPINAYDYLTMRLSSTVDEY